MICKSCGVIVTRRTKKNLCAKCFTGRDIREVLLFTVKAWKKIDIEKQMYLLRIYDVVLTDHKTRREKVIHILKKINKKNMNTGIDKFNRGVNTASKELNKMHFGDNKDLSKAFGLNEKPSKNRYKILTG